MVNERAILSAHRSTDLRQAICPLPLGAPHNRGGCLVRLTSEIHGNAVHHDDRLAPGGLHLHSRRSSHLTPGWISSGVSGDRLQHPVRRCCLGCMEQTFEGEHPFDRGSGKEVEMNLWRACRRTARCANLAVPLSTVEYPACRGSRLGADLAGAGAPVNPAHVTGGNQLQWKTCKHISC